MHLEDDVADTISYLSEEEVTSYDISLAKFKKRFDWKPTNLKANRHLDQIYNLKQVIKLEDYKSLRQSHSKITTHTYKLGDPTAIKELNERLRHKVLRK